MATLETRLQALDLQRTASKPMLIEVVRTRLDGETYSTLVPAMHNTKPFGNITITRSYGGHHGNA